MYVSACDHVYACVGVHVSVWICGCVYIYVCVIINQ